MDIAQQLEIFGLDETRRQVEASSTSARERARLIRRVETTHDILSSFPENDDLSFLHSGLCQTCLPHSKPAHNHTVWRRTSGRFTLSIAPGTIHRKDAAPEDDGYVGVPYGSKARLILIHLQTEGLRSRTVNLGPSLSAFMRSLGLAVTGGERGSIAATKEQVLRIARCSFSLQWTDTDAAGTHTRFSDQRIVDGLDLWSAETGDAWNGTVELSARFHEQLREHCVPLDKRAIAELKSNSLGLDLYALFAYRLPRLRESLHLRWRALQSQIGSEETAMKELARRVRGVLPDVMSVYPHAKVEVTPTGLTLRPSEPAVPKNSVRGYKLIDG
jgi:Plasmid encoded RepA protein